MMQFFASMHQIYSLISISVSETLIVFIVLTTAIRCNPLLNNYLDEQSSNGIAGNNKMTGSYEQIPSIDRRFTKRAKREQSESSGANVCLTPACYKAAAEIKQNMDDSVSPCDDFHQYTCGNWIKTQQIPDEKSSISMFSINQDELDKNLRIIIEREPQENEPNIFNELRSYYKSCMNTTHLELLGSKPLVDILEQVGGWPVLARETSSGVENNESDWIDLLAKFRAIGIDHNFPFALSIGTDLKNATRNIIYIDQPNLHMPAYYKITGENGKPTATWRHYFNLMMSSAIYLGGTEAQANPQLRDVFAFELNLYNDSLSAVERRNYTNLYNNMTVNALVELAPNTNWTKFFDTLLVDKITGEEEVVVFSLKYIVEVDKLLAKTDKRVISNYLIWNFIYESMAYLDDRWHKLMFDYNKLFSGVKHEKPRWLECLNSVSERIDFPLSSMYVRDYFKPESRKVAREMVDYIRREFLAILDEIDWMDKETNEAAREKALAMNSQVGYPDQLLNETLIETLHEGLKLNSQEYLNNWLKIKKWSIDYQYKDLRAKNDRNDWRLYSSAASTDAFYHPSENTIELRAGILKGNFFDSLRPNYLNFGAIGSIIGHELTHGFDDSGRQFDKDGRNVNWWRNETDVKFKERAKCMIDQYSNYTLNGNNLNGLHTQDENIADNGGFKQAFRAYQKWVQANGEEPLLPGIELNQMQLFWISSTTVWCNKDQPEFSAWKLIYDSHSPHKFRSFGSLSNIKEFSETFNCPLGSPMNPEKKCAIW